VLLLPCAHFFHTACIERWLAIKTTCPKCRHALAPPVPEMREVTVRRSTTIEWMPVLQWVPASTTTIEVRSEAGSDMETVTTTTTRPVDFRNLYVLSEEQFAAVMQAAPVRAHQPPHQGPGFNYPGDGSSGTAHGGGSAEASGEGERSFDQEDVGLRDPSPLHSMGMPGLSPPAGYPPAYPHPPPFGASLGGGDGGPGMNPALFQGMHPPLALQQPQPYPGAVPPLPMPSSQPIPPAHPWAHRLSIPPGAPPPFPPADPGMEMNTSAAGGSMLGR